MTIPTNRIPRRVRLTAPAKVNLHLEVLKHRHDGYHDIETIFQALDILDRVQVTLLEIRPGDVAPEIELLVDAEAVTPAGMKPEDVVPSDDHNLCVQAARAFCREAGVSGRLQIALHKEIPVAAGLGGGSSDAMAVLVGCDRLFHTGYDRVDLERMGCLVGSDVPFFAAGGTQLGRGRGTELTPLPTPVNVHFVVLKPHFGNNTGSTYSELKMGLTVRSPAANLQVIKPLLARFPSRPWFGFNRLEEVILPTRPELGRILLSLREEAPIAMLAGSGSAVFAVVENLDQAKKMLEEHTSSVEFARVVKPLSSGVGILEG